MKNSSPWSNSGDAISDAVLDDAFEDEERVFNDLASFLDANPPKYVGSAVYALVRLALIGALTGDTSVKEARDFVTAALEINLSRYES